MPAKKYGKWGFINKNGEWIISSKFEEAFYFSEGLAAVEYFGNWGYIDRTGEWVIQPAYRDAKPFTEGLACVMKNNKLTYDNNSPLLKETRKPPLKLVKYHNYGLKKLKKNIYNILLP